MVRKLALAVSLALGTLSVPAHALGLGELESKSALNQNFIGDIRLLSVGPEDLDAVRVQLADAEAFGRAGIERPFYLSLLRFEPTVSGTGRPIIRVTSDFPIREPFLNFLVEVNWPNGRLLREYTVLLDPPTTTKRRPPQVAPAVTSRPAQATPKPAPTRPAAAPQPAPQAVKKASPTVSSPQVSSGPSEYGPVKSNDTAWSISKRTRPRGVSMEQMMMALLEANPHAFIDNNINRLRKGKILRIPSLDEIQELSRQQARTAYRAQQDAWLARRNEKLQSAAASTEGPAPDEPAASAAPQAAAAAADQLKIATARPDGEGEAGAGEDDALAPTATDLKSRLIAARENAETSRQEAEVLRSQVDDLQARLQDMQKLLSLKDDQLAQLQDRVIQEEPLAGASAEDTLAPLLEAATEATAADAALSADQQALADTADSGDAMPEPGVADTERMLEEAAARVQQVAQSMADSVPPGDYRIQDIPPQIDPDRIVNLSIEPQVDAGSVVEEATSVIDAPAQVEAVVEPVVEEAGADLGSGAEIVVDAGQDAAPSGDTEILVTGQADQPVASLDSAPADESSVAAVEPQPAEQAASGGGSVLPPALLALVEKNIVPIAAGGVGLLGLFGWLATRRRRDADPSADAAAAAGAAVPAADQPGVDEPAIAKRDLEELPDSAFLDEFAPSEMNSLQDETGEVDPVSEADVYIAYGRYQQAEELLRQALQREPERLALKHKLLEVHYATRDAQAFAALAQEMVDAGQDAADEDAWIRAQDMGRELAPGNPLFALEDGDVDRSTVVKAAAAMGAVAAGASAAEAIDGDTLSLDDLELSELASEYEITEATEDLERPSEVSIQLDSEMPQAAAPEVADLNAPDEGEMAVASAETEDAQGLDFELPEAEVGDETLGVDTDVSEMTESLDIDGMLAEAEAAVDNADSSLEMESEFSADDLQAQLDELSDLNMPDSAAEAAQRPAQAEPPANLGLVAEDVPEQSDVLDEPISLDNVFDTTGGDEETLDLDDSMPPQADDMDEVEDVATKLDLARAYVEMGDADGARDILEEVVAEGDDSQRGEAQQMLGQLG